MASERGFTLIEVLVVMAVLSVGVLGVLQTTLLAARLERRSEAITAGTLLAQEGLERIGALGWEAATAGLVVAGLPDELGMAGAWPQQEVVRPDGRYLLVFERESPPGPAPRSTVHCFWRDAAGGFDPRQAVHLAARRRR